MPTIIDNCQLEIDDRGVIYLHAAGAEHGLTILRIKGLPPPAPGQSPIKTMFDIRVDTARVSYATVKVGSELRVVVPTASDHDHDTGNHAPSDHESRSGRLRPCPSFCQNAEPLVHLLHEGRVLCGELEGVPAEWPDGHRWVSASLLLDGMLSDQAKNLLHPACKEKLRQQIADEDEAIDRGG